MRKRTHYTVRTLGFGGVAFIAYGIRWHGEEITVTLHATIRYGEPLSDLVWQVAR